MQFSAFIKLFAVAAVAFNSATASTLTARSPQATPECVVEQGLCTTLGTLTCCPGLECQDTVSLGEIGVGVSICSTFLVP